MANAIPTISPRLLKLFTGYAKWFVGRQFHTLRLWRGGAVECATLLKVCPGRPLVFFVNHASWWDPLICLLLAQARAPERRHFAPIDAGMLERYRFFRRLGFFGVEPGTRHGGVAFLRQADAILREPGTALWITPQGRFADNRERPLRFKPGLGHLAARHSSALFVPVAIDYAFWEERTPEVLIAAGEPMDAAGESLAADAWTVRFEHAMTGLLDSLGAASVRRDSREFEPLLHGRAGVGGVYDLWRSVRAAWSGEVFQPQHSTK